MMKTKERIDITLSIYPNSYGFGFTVAENFRELIDYGVVKISPIQNKKTLKRFIEFLEFYNPNVVVLRNYSEKNTKKNTRIMRLLDKMILKAKERKLKVFRYSREDIRNVFDQFNSKTKYEICKTLIKWYPQLKQKLPKERKAWESDSYSMSYFDALSLLVTHLYIST